MEGDKIIHSRISDNEWMVVNVLQKQIVIYNNDVTNISDIHKNNLDENSPNIMLSENSYECVFDEDNEEINNKLFVAYTYKETKGKIVDQGRTYVNTDPKSCVNEWIYYITNNAFNNDKGLVITRDIKVLNEGKPKPFMNILLDKDNYIEIVCKAGGKRCLK